KATGLRGIGYQNVHAIRRLSLARSVGIERRLEAGCGNTTRFRAAAHPSEQTPEAGALADQSSTGGLKDHENRTRQKKPEIRRPNSGHGSESHLCGQLDWMRFIDSGTDPPTLRRNHLQMAGIICKWPESTSRTGIIRHAKPVATTVLPGSEPCRIPKQIRSPKPKTSPRKHAG